MTEKAVLSDASILNYIKHGLLIETPINGIQLQPNSVDLTLGNTYKSLLPNAMDVSLTKNWIGFLKLSMTTFT